MINLNENLKNNKRDLLSSYLLGFFIYVIIGIVGCFGISGQYPCDKIIKKDTIMDLFLPTSVNIETFLFFYNAKLLLLLLMQIRQERVFNFKITYILKLK